MQYNLFVYCNDNPVGNSDRTGHDPFIDAILCSVVIGEWQAVIAVTSKCIETGQDPISLHYNRNKFYEVPEDLSIVKKTWTKVPPGEAKEHLRADVGQGGGDNKYNEKYLHYNADGSSYEAVICSPDDGRDPYLVVDNGNMGTYYFCSPVYEPSLRWFSSRVAHGLADYIPYKIFGG